MDTEQLGDKVFNRFKVVQRTIDYYAAQRDALRPRIEASRAADPAEHERLEREYADLLTATGDELSRFNHWAAALMGYDHPDDVPDVTDAQLAEVAADLKAVGVEGDVLADLKECGVRCQN